MLQSSSTRQGKLWNSKHIISLLPFFLDGDDGFIFKFMNEILHTMHKGHGRFNTSYLVRLSLDEGSKF